MGCGLIHEVEEVVALVVDHDEGGKVDDINFPHRLHTQFGVFKYFDMGDAILRETGRGPTD